MMALWFQVGAGVSLPGMVAAKCGAEVVLSDGEELPRCLQSCRRSCLANRLPHIPVLGLTWGRVSPELLALPPVDIILGSDVFFDPKGMLILWGIFDLRTSCPKRAGNTVKRGGDSHCGDTVLMNSSFLGKF